MGDNDGVTRQCVCVRGTERGARGQKIEGGLGLCVFLPDSGHKIPKQSKQLFFLMSMICATSATSLYTAHHLPSCFRFALTIILEFSPAAPATRFFPFDTFFFFLLLWFCSFPHNLSPRRRAENKAVDFLFHGLFRKRALENSQKKLRKSVWECVRVCVCSLSSRLTRCAVMEFLAICVTLPSTADRKLNGLVTCPRDLPPEVCFVCVSFQPDPRSHLPISSFRHKFPCSNAPLSHTMTAPSTQRWPLALCAVSTQSLLRFKCF